MRRNEKLLRLASVLEICDEHDLTDDCVFMYCCKCVNDLADISIEAVQRQLDKPEIRSCRIPLVIDFEQMTDPDYWLKSKLFCEALSERSEPLRQKILQLVDMLQMLQMKILQVDAEYAEQVFKRMAARLKKSTNTLDYKKWKVQHPNPTMEQLERQQVQLTADMLIAGILEYDEDASGDEIAEVKLELVRRGLRHGQQLPENFIEECAKLKRYSYWNGKHMFMINYHEIYIYLFSHCFEKFTEKQRIVLYEYDVQLRMIHEDMMRLMPELAEYLHTSMPHQSCTSWEEHHEALFRFVHPSLSGEREWEIHDEVKRLVRRQGIQEICSYLLEMQIRGDIYLPQMPSMAYAELVRMGMPKTDGYSEKYFSKHYRRN